MIIHQLGILLAKTDCPKKRALIWDLYDSVQDLRTYNSYLLGKHFTSKLDSSCN
jgi:hypothetical protein